jgi:hypothetical protein
VNERPIDLLSENVDCVIRGGPLTEHDGSVKPHETVEADLLIEYPFELSIKIVGNAAVKCRRAPARSRATSR